MITFIFSYSRPHFFDSEERKSSNPHRKSGTHDKGGIKGAESIREKFHKCNHEKILPHSLLNINVTEINRIVTKNAKKS